MMTYVEYFGDSYFLAWCSLWLFWAIILIVILVVDLIKRILRSLNIWFRGWPPAHLDGDGDFLTEDEVYLDESQKATN